MEKSLWKSIKAFAYHYKGRFISAFLMVLTSNILLICNPLVFRQAVMAMDPSSGSPDEKPLFFKILLGPYFYSLDVWVLILVMISLSAAAFKYWMRILFISMSREVERRTRYILFTKIQEQSRSFFDRHTIGGLMSRLTNDISAYREVLGPGVMYPLFFITLVIPAIIGLFSISPPLATLSLLPLFILPVLILIMQGYFFTSAMALQKALGSISSFTQEEYSGIRIVKGYVTENTIVHRFSEASNHLSKCSLRLATLEGLFFPLLTSINRLVTVLLVLFAAFIILKGWRELSTADFISFMWIQGFAFGPILMLGWVLPIYQRGSAAYNRLLEIYEEPVEVQYAPEPSVSIQPGADIAFHNLTFTYPESKKPAISNLDLLIKGGSIVGITGSVGVGKTTLFQLLMREYEVPAGTITIGGRDIHEYSQNEIRNHIATVEQMPFLFSRTIAENVRFGRDESSQEDIERVTRLADLHETVMLFPNRYDTIVGERGVTLSGGQKQRVAIARAFLGEQTILLLDDIFSNVDVGTEKRIFSEMKAQFEGKTVLLISHRFTILEEMDRVIYLKDGRVVEDGSPEELKKKKSHFAAMADLQSSGFDPTDWLA